MEEEAGKKFTLAMLQVKTSKNKRKNLEIVQKMSIEAKSKGAQVLILPEFFNTPYEMHLVPE